MAQGRDRFGQFAGTGSANRGSSQTAAPARLGDALRVVNQARSMKGKGHFEKSRALYKQASQIYRQLGNREKAKRYAEFAEKKRMP